MTGPDSGNSKPDNDSTAKRFPSLNSIAEALATKGYGLAFRDGHLVLLNHDGNPICTGSALGVPLREISARIGRPSIRASADGCKGSLR